jgi:hypothetical protein
VAHEASQKERIVISEFPSLVQAIAAHDSPAYQEALKALGDDADPDLDALFFGHGGIALGETALQRHRAFDRIDHRAKLGEHAVAHDLEDAPVMAGDLRLEQLLTPGLQPLMRACLVAVHERRVADDIGGENGSELSVHDDGRPDDQEELRGVKIRPVHSAT